MDKKVLDGVKQGIGFFSVMLLIFSVYAVGFHQPQEVVTGVFQGDYTFNGSLVLENSNESCDKEGEVRYKGERLEVCNGSSWNPSDRDKVYSSCQDAYNDGERTSKNYMIDPDGKGSGVDPFEIYCDMRDGEGWIKLSLLREPYGIHIGAYDRSTNIYKCSGYELTRFENVPDHHRVRGDSIRVTWPNGNNAFKYSLYYENPVTEDPYTISQMDAIRSIVSDMHPETRQTVVTCDDDGESNPNGHEVKIYAKDGTSLLVSAQTSGNNDYDTLMWHTNSTYSKNLDGGENVGTLSSKFVLPSSIELFHTDGASKGGGVAWGYEKGYVLVN